MSGSSSPGADFSTVLEDSIRRFRSRVHAELSAVGVAYRTVSATGDLNGDIQTLVNATRQTDELLAGAQVSEAGQAQARAQVQDLQTLLSANVGFIKIDLSALEADDLQFIAGQDGATEDQSRLKASAARLGEIDADFAGALDAVMVKIQAALNTFADTSQPSGTPAPAPTPAPSPLSPPDIGAADDGADFAPSLEGPDEEALEDDLADEAEPDDAGSDEGTTPSDMFVSKPGPLDGLGVLPDDDDHAAPDWDGDSDETETSPDLEEINP